MTEECLYFPFPSECVIELIAELKEFLLKDNYIVTDSSCGKLNVESDISPPLTVWIDYFPITLIIPIRIQTTPPIRFNEHMPSYERLIERLTHYKATKYINIKPANDTS